MSRAWFYLTLWNGTPPEFTDEFEVRIRESDAFDAAVQESSAAETQISTVEAYAADVESLEEIGTDVITSTGVIWYVG